VTIHPMGELKRGEADAISTSPTKGKAGPAQGRLRNDRVDEPNGSRGRFPRRALAHPMRRTANSCAAAARTARRRSSPAGAIGVSAGRKRMRQIVFVCPQVV
jgi:hypothetical protein